MRALSILLLLPFAAVYTLSAQNGLMNATPPGRNCGPAEQPSILPSGNEVVDSAALVRPLTAAARMLLSLRFEDAGRRRAVAVLETDQDSASTESLRAAIQAAVRAPPRVTKSVWALRLRVVGGTSPSLTLEQSTFCPAEPRGGAPSSIVTIMSRADTAAAGDSTGRMLPPERQQVRLAATLRVSPRGEVTEVTLTTSSGQRDSDNQFAQRWRRMRFLPALLDGFAVAVTYDTESGHSSPD